MKQGYETAVSTYSAVSSKACQLMANQTFPAWGWKKQMSTQRNNGPFAKLKENGVLNTCCTTGNIMQNCSYHWIWEYNLIWEINVFPSPIVSISIISIYSIHITNIYLYLLLISVFVSACATSTCASLRSVLEVVYLPCIANLVMKNSE